MQWDYNRLKSSGLGWVLYAVLFVSIAGIMLIAVGLTVVPGPLLLVGILLLAVGGWGVSRLFPRKAPQRRGIPKELKIAVWEKYMGKRAIRGKCYACLEREITIHNFEAGHDKPKAKGGPDIITNLRPICTPCNRAMGDRYTIEEYKQMRTGLATTRGTKS